MKTLLEIFYPEKTKNIQMNFKVIRLNSIDWLFINIDHEDVTKDKMDELKESMMEAGLQNVFIFNLPITE